MVALHEADAHTAGHLAMFLHETVQHCTTCDELTPHNRRVIALPKLLSALALAVAGWCFLRSAGSWLLGGILLVAVAYGLLHDRERSWAVHCERCRGKKLRGLGRTKPTLDGSTEINLF
jgi:hypothetical protein